MVKLCGNTAETVTDIPEVQHFVKIALNGAEGGNDLLFRTKLLDLFL